MQNNIVRFSSIGINQKFKLLGVDHFIYEKLDEQLFKGARERPTNAYNLMKQQYTYVDETQAVIPFTHTY
jgi:hypothetical protein